MNDLKVLVMPLGEIALVEVKFLNQRKNFKELVDAITEHVELTLVSEKGSRESLNKVTTYKINRNDVRLQIFPSGRMAVSFKGGINLHSTVPFETIELMKRQVKQVKLMISSEEFDKSIGNGMPLYEVVCIEGIQ